MYKWTRRETFAAGTVAAMAAAVVTAKALYAGRDMPEAAHAALLAGVVIAVAAALTNCVLYWRSLDEAAKEAHKWAWYWGGSVGLGVGGGVVGYVLGYGLIRPGQSLDHLSLGHGDAGIFAAGALAVIGMQTIGYFVAWAGWWLSKR